MNRLSVPGAEAPPHPVLDDGLLKAWSTQAQATCTGEFSCAIVDPRGGGRWHCQGEVVRPAASLIKVPILIELHARAEAGELDLDERVSLTDACRVGGAGVLFELHSGLELTLRDLGVLMIVVSDNTASNMLIRRLGMDAINARIQGAGMVHSSLGRQFMEDPAVVGGDNLTTACDMATCLARLYQGELLGAPATREVVGVLARQQYREKIPLLLPEALRVAHKTGELDGTRHDAALVLRGDGPYVIACLTTGVRDVLAADRAIAEFSKAVYDWMERCQKTA